MYTHHKQSLQGDPPLKANWGKTKTLMTRKNYFNDFQGNDSQYVTKTIHFKYFIYFKKFSIILLKQRLQGDTR